MKRLLSIILAIAMILTLVPSVFANGETETDGIEIEYSFLKADYNTSLTNQKDLTYANSGGRIRYDAENTTSTSSTIANWGSVNNGVYNYPYFNCSADGRYVTFRINIPKAATYTATLDYWVSQNLSAVSDIYLIPCSGNEILATALNRAPVFSVSFNKSENQSNNMILDKQETFTAEVAGEYYLVIKRVSTGGACRIRGLTLSQDTTTKTPTLIYADVALGKTEIDAGLSEETEIILSNVYMSDGVAATDAQKAAIAYTSSDESVAKIENGKVKAVCHGTATISAVVDDYVLGSADVTVTNSKASQTTIEYSFTKNAYGSDATPITISYERSKGRLKFIGDSGWAGDLAGWTGSADGAFYNMNIGGFVAFEIRVPKAGLYNAKFDYLVRTSGATSDVYILPKQNGDISDIIKDKTPVFKNVNFKGSASGKASVSAPFDAEFAGEYYLIFSRTGGDSASRPSKLTLNGNGTETPLIYADVSLGKTTLEVKETTTLTKGTPYLSNGSETDATGVIYKSTDANVATISDETVTAVAPGTTKIQALRADGYVLDEEIVTINTPEYTEAFGDDTFETKVNVNVDPAVVAVAYAKDETLSQTATGATKNGNGTWSIETPEEIDEYTFRYWARGLETGNKRIVSLENNFTYSPEKGDANYLIAVYTNNSETQTKEYFNANGQLLVGADDNTKPYMLGYGYATGWKDNGNGIKEAVYGEGVKSYKISVNGVEKSYDYGTKITCPTVEAPEGKYFLGWKKTVGGKETAELVSTDMNYSFYAWEECTVTPAFGDAEATFTGIARKILISSFAIENGDSVVMAEFIGFDNAVERGITLDKDYAMSNKNANQFTIINDVDVASANISAYAILADGTKFIYNLK